MLSKAKIKYIQSLGHKKLRDQDGVFIAEGPKVVEELLLSGKFNCHILYSTKQWLENHRSELPSSIEEIDVVEQFELEKMSQLTTPHDVLAVFSQTVLGGREFDKEESVKNIDRENERGAAGGKLVGGIEKGASAFKQDVSKFANKLSLVLDGIRDPGNMGTIIRIADWFAVENIICSEDSVDCFNPKVVQASMGSLGRVNISYAELSSFIRENNGIRVYAATLDGGSVFTLGKVSEGFVVIGNESTGIREPLLKLVNEEISIPRLGMAESLNAAVACGIILSSIT